MHTRPVPRFLYLMLGLVGLGMLLDAQGVASSGASDGSLTNLLQPGYIEQRIASFSNRTDLADEVLQESLKVAQQCIAFRDDLARLASERASLVQATQSASNRLAELQARLREPVEEPSLDVPTNSPPRVLEQRAAEVEAELAIAQAEKERLDAEPNRRAERRVKIASLTTEYRNNLKELETASDEAADAQLPEEYREALALRGTLSKEFSLQRIRNLNLELASYEATTELVTAQQVLARRRVASLTTLLGQIKAALNTSRAEASAQAAAAAEHASRRAEALNLPVVTVLAETNKHLAQTRVSVSDMLQSTSRQLEQTEAQLAELRASHDSLRELVDVARESGVTRDYAIGLALRQEQYALPSTQRVKGEARQRAEQMTVTRIQLIRLAEQQEAYADVERRLAKIRVDLPADLREWQKDEAVEECRRLLEERRALLLDLSKDYQTLRGLLAELSQAQQEWAKENDGFRSLIAEQVLWFRSTDVLSLSGIRAEVKSIGRVVGGEIRTGLLPYFRQDWQHHPLPYLWGALVLLALLASRLPLAAGLRRTCPPHTPEARLSIKPALLALLYTTLLTLPIPVLLIFLGWRLDGYTGTSALAEHWAHAMLFSGSGVLVIEFFRQLSRVPGLAVTHLRWPEHNARLLRFHFTWVVWVGIPLSIVTDVLEGVFIEGVSNRMLFLVGQVLLLLLGHLLLRSSRGLRFGSHDGEVAVQKPLRFQRFYHLLVIAIPVSLMTLSVLGYTYTARQIWLRVGDSIQWGLVVLLATMLLLHWLTVLRRRMAVQKVEQRKTNEESKPVEAAAAPDIWQVYSQSRRLFATLLWIIMAVGLWVIWVDMLPALKKLDQIPIPLVSHAAVEVDGGGSASLVSVMNLEPGQTAPEGAPDPEESVMPLGRRDFLSVADIIGALIVLMLTVAASRNLPGFVEMVLLSRVRFRQGEGYALVTILRYLVLLLGIGWALTLIGITWNKVQWLAAAVTVGIGFGLQEIFANFVSGLILLFERPVRVGDIITVGQVTGTVTRIQMRATTVRNWDQQELVLPNKDLITGQVINWTLSNDVSRLALTVGVSYQADVKRATELLLEIATANPNVKKDPAPFVTFDEFADSTLNLVVRAYVSIEVRLSTKSQLNNAILERFREAGIEIAYPQRDLHLRSVASDLAPLPIKENPPAS